jgi:hypothetical protein
VPWGSSQELDEFTRNDKRGDQLWLTPAGARQVDTVSSALVSRIVDKLAQSPTFEGRPDREQVEAALERIAHRVLVQRDWTHDRRNWPPPAEAKTRTCFNSSQPGVRFGHEPDWTFR